MSDSSNEGFSHESPEMAPDEAGPVGLAARGAQKGVLVVLSMRPDRVGGGLAEDEDGQDAAALHACAHKSYSTTSWFFASEFLDRVADVASQGCTGYKVKPVKVELSFDLDEKAFRNVKHILASFDNAFRGL